MNWLVILCRYVAITIRNESVPLPGWVGLYTGYNTETRTVDKIRDIPGMTRDFELHNYSLNYTVMNKVLPID